MHVAVRVVEGVVEEVVEEDVEGDAGAGHKGHNLQGALTFSVNQMASGAV